MLKLVSCFAWIVFLSTMHAQSISGHFSLLASEEITLEGFDGLKTYPISNTTINEKGYFALNYSKSDYGVGYLISSNDKPLFVILSGEDIEIEGELLSKIETLRTIKGQENLWFEQYAREHPKREQALSAWTYLEKIYDQDTLFSIHQTAIKAIQHEKSRIKAEDDAFLSGLPGNSYVHWFLPVRKLISSVSVVAQYRPQEIPSTLKALRTIDYSDQKLYKSGLLRDAIESHVWFIENSSSPLDSVYAELNRSIDIMLSQLQNDEKKYNETTDFLYNLLEKRSLYTSSEHLALQVLEEKSCTVDSKLSNKLEGYRKMKKGNIAPNIVFGEFTYLPDHVSAVDLRTLNTEYILVVFAAGWCSHCIGEIPKIVPLYEKWKNYNVEVVLVSLDETPRDFARFAAAFPFISTTDYKKWDSKSVLDYHIFGTPSFFLLNKDLEIILRLKSVEQMDAWVNWFLAGEK
ncbi:MAG TPA: thioredoxin-like domain-containing protein [Saprospiraceae bacterium]|nr:thioredoxin-like domain-containing protein [Saprospiraceae bacterium]